MPDEEHNQHGDNDNEKPELVILLLKFRVSINVAEQTDSAAPLKRNENRKH